MCTCMAASSPSYARTASKGDRRKATVRAHAGQWASALLQCSDCYGNLRGHKPARGQVRGARQAAQHEGRAGQLVTVGGAMMHAHLVSPDGFARVLDHVRAVTIVGRSFISLAPDQHHELLPAARELVAVAVLGEDAEVRAFSCWLQKLRPLPTSSHARSCMAPAATSRRSGEPTTSADCSLIDRLRGPQPSGA